MSELLKLPPETAPASPVRSWLFVPGDSERKQDKALARAKADAVILDLEDSVAWLCRCRRAREAGRATCCARRASGGPQLWVRVNSPGGRTRVARGSRGEVGAATPARCPEGVVVPKVSSTPKDRQRRAVPRARSRPSFGRPPGQHAPAGDRHPDARRGAGVAAVPGGRSRRPRRSPPASQVSPGASEDLSAALGALRPSATRTAHFTFTFQLVRTQCLLAAAALGVQAVDGAAHRFSRRHRDWHASYKQARGDGFTGKLAIHPDQISGHQRSFRPE